MMMSHELAQKLLDMPDCEILVSVDVDSISGNNYDKVSAKSIIEVSYDKGHAQIELHMEECSANFIFGGEK